MIRKKICIGREIREQLTKEFKVGKQTIYHAMNYFYDTELHREIRKRTKELL
ncbi:hypothetical protein FUAX_33270 [Fulvitalea axinellae]|uniref:Uncharacterized protein n=1 Tax=Fulvitalea axinellae TaxID=1182444 RepID=A0AAU9CNB4_9BACT|nr:hypothetical protein FUAX_33270 [Fulvitalea axinellae]